jgi:mRNA interferase MazF
MGTFAAGQVVIVHFPFSDLTTSKLRPAVVLAEAGRGDWILCQITSKSYGDTRAIPLEAADFARGSLRLASFARPGKLFTAHTSLIASQAGELKPAKFSTVRDAVVRILQKA